MFLFEFYSHNGDFYSPGTQALEGLRLMIVAHQLKCPLQSNIVCCTTLAPCSMTSMLPLERTPRVPSFAIQKLFCSLFASPLLCSPIPQPPVSSTLVSEVYSSNSPRLVPHSYQWRYQDRNQYAFGGDKQAPSGIPRMAV